MLNITIIMCAKFITHLEKIRVSPNYSHQEKLYEVSAFSHSFPAKALGFGKKIETRPLLPPHLDVQASTCQCMKTPQLGSVRNSTTQRSYYWFVLAHRTNNKGRVNHLLLRSNWPTSIIRKIIHTYIHKNNFPQKKCMIFLKHKRISITNVDTSFSFGRKQMLKLESMTKYKRKIYNVKKNTANADRDSCSSTFSTSYKPNYQLVSTIILSNHVATISQLLSNIKTKTWTWWKQNYCNTKITK